MQGCMIRKRGRDVFRDGKDGWRPARSSVGTEPHPRGLRCWVPTARLAYAPSWLCVRDSKHTARSAPQHTSVQGIDLEISFMITHFLLYVLGQRLLHWDNKARQSHGGRVYFHFSLLFTEFGKVTIYKRQRIRGGLQRLASLNQFLNLKAMHNVYRVALLLKNDNKQWKIHKCKGQLSIKKWHCWIIKRDSKS